MRLTALSLVLLPVLTRTTFALLQSPYARATPRSLDALLVDSQKSAPSPSPTLYLRNLELRDTSQTSPYPQHLDLRQVAAAQPAPVQPAANAPAQPAANAQAQPAANAQAQPAPVVNPAPAAAGAGAPVVGVGGGGAAAAQPAPGAQANPVTTIQVETVVGGVTKTVPKIYTQSFGAGQAAPAVQTGSIGMGTLTGQIGVVKTAQAKNDAISTTCGRGVGGSIILISASWIVAMAIGGGLLGIGISL